MGNLAPRSAGTHTWAPQWQLWSTGPILSVIEGIHPVLASWDANHHPAKIRERAFVDDVAARIRTVELPARGLCLHIDVAVRSEDHLLRHHDLENYLTPVMRRLGAQRFVYASGTKRRGGSSRISIGVAVPRVNSLTRPVWEHFSHRAGRGTETKRWKAGIRDALAASCPTLLPPGPVEVHLAWRCSPTRNWANLWKPTGDAMGPVLGPLDPPNPFNPHDDRIVTLGLHLNAAADLRHDVDVGMWWRSAGDASTP